MYTQPKTYGGGGVIGDKENINHKGFTGEVRPPSNASAPDCTDCTETRQKSEALCLVDMRDGASVVATTSDYACRPSAYW